MENFPPSAVCRLLSDEVFMFSEITVTQLGEKLKSDEKFILLDVRELRELDQAKV